MTINVSKLHRELEAGGLSIFGVNTDAVIAWDGTPTSGDLSTAAAIIAAHNPINQIDENWNLNIEDMITKAHTWREFFYTNRNIDFSTMDTATQNLVIKRLMFLAIHILDEFLSIYNAFYEDPP